MTDSKGKQRLTIYLPLEMTQAVKHAAVEKRTTISSILELLIRNSSKDKKLDMRLLV